MKKIFIIVASATLTFATQAAAQTTSDTPRVVKLAAKSPTATPLPSGKASAGASTANASVKESSAAASAVSARKAAPMTLQADTAQLNVVSAKPAARSSGKMRTATPPSRSPKTSTARAKN